MCTFRQYHRSSGQISVDDRRRSQLATIFRDEDNEEMVGERFSLNWWYIFPFSLSIIGCHLSQRKERPTY